MSAGKGRVVPCQVEDCSNQAPQKAYYQRYRICKHHSCLPSLEHDGRQQRWCQQCGRFQELSEFDGDKRTCRAKLSHHNLRRKAARSRNNSLSEDGSISQLAAASSLHSELSSWGPQSPAACHAEHSLPPGSGHEQPRALRWGKPPYSPRRRPALPHRLEAPTLQLPLRAAVGQQQQQQRGEEVEEERQTGSRHGYNTGQPPPVLLQPASVPSAHVAGQQHSRQQAGQHKLKVLLRAPQQQRQQLQWGAQGQAGQPTLHVDLPPMQREQRQHMDVQQAQREHARQAGQGLFLRPHVQQQHQHQHSKQQPSLHQGKQQLSLHQGKQQPSLHQGKQQELLKQQQNQQQQQQDTSSTPRVPHQESPAEQPQWGGPSTEALWQRLHSQHSMQSEGDALPAQLAMWARQGLGWQQQLQPPLGGLSAAAPPVGQGVATSATMQGDGQQDRLGAGSSRGCSLSASASADGTVRGRHPAAGRMQPHAVLPAARILPHQPLSHADLAAMLSAPARVCRLHAGTAERESPFHVLVPATEPGAALGQLPSPTAGPAPTAHRPSLATAQPLLTASPLGARAAPQQQQQQEQQQPPVVAAGGSQASPGGNIDDILELLSWGSPKEDEAARGSLDGSWLSPPALPLSLRGSPLEQARAPTPFFPDALLPP